MAIPEHDVLEIAKEAIKGKKDGRSVKEIEQYIKHGRKTGEW
ncbi:MAG: PCYCGC domain-containing protein [Defluviitaleaceae bacterium]|nr:PCYCGC domain-containing protein [Defluviitaleaceae bacterium]